jgi:microcystin-dependent protein
MVIRTGLFLVLISTLAVAGFAQDSLSITPGGDVGIGTATPAEKLEVDGNIKAVGRIMDETGFVMPVGSIIPFGGTTAPEGWLLCDGTAVSRTTYEDLFVVIGTAFGGGDGSTTFHLPDLRGQVLRGVDQGAGVDPDAASRTELNTGGNTGDAVGSKQEDAFQDHKHEHRIGADSGTSNNAVRNTASGQILKDYGIINAGRGGGTPRTSSETRPKNVYVNFIIKI